MTFEEFISELKSDLTKYEMAGQIDELSIYKYFSEALKSFGLHISEQNEAVIKVTNNTAYLPDDFNTLKIAYRCSPKDYYIESGFSKKNFNSPLWQERKLFFGECNSDVKDEDCIEEKIVIELTPVYFRYHNLIPLTLSKNSNKKRYSMDCESLFINSQHSITLFGNEAKFDFKNGYVFMKYYSLPSDEEGKLIIPEIGNGMLNKYVEVYVKKRFFETLLYKDPDPNIGGILQYLSNELLIMTDKAKSDVRWSNITPETFKKIQLMELARKKRYEIKFPSRL